MKVRTNFLFAGVLVTTMTYTGATAVYADICTDAMKKVPSLSSLQGSKLTKQEDLIMHLCSNGPAGRIV